MTMDIGPFTFYRVPDSETLDVSLTCLGDYPLGWEYGWADPQAGLRSPWLSIRIGKLVVFEFEKFTGGFELRVLGFWWIP